MDKIKWGIIGCGDVTEVKSGPAFNKVSNSSLVAVMRRDGAMAKDYAQRHGVAKWYDDAAKLINDTDVNAIYIATPPSSHETYALAAIDAGKAVYVEKPMSINAEAACRMADYAALMNVKLSVAHYRRAQPQFKKIKQLLDDKAIGDIRFAKIDYFKRPLTSDELRQPKAAWRIDPAISGGGLFHDIAPHQVDLLYYFFGAAERVNGISLCQGSTNQVDDFVAGNILFKNGIAFSGVWSFTVAKGQERDCCEIIGLEGKISFSVFDIAPVTLITGNKTEIFHFDILPHVQQPMIEKVVDYFLDKGPNPCSGNEGATVMKIMGQLTGR